MSRFAAVLLACLATQAWGATDCRLITGGNLVFAPYDTLSAAPSDSLVSVQISCTRNGGPKNVNITLSISAGGSGSVAARRMVRAGTPVDYLSYNLFRDVSRAAVWGWTPGVDTMTQSLSIANNSTATGTFTIYGRLPAQQNVYAGDYGDSVTLTLSP